MAYFTLNSFINVKLERIPTRAAAVVGLGMRYRRTQLSTVAVANAAAVQKQNMVRLPSRAQVKN